MARSSADLRRCQLHRCATQRQPEMTWPIGSAGIPVLPALVTEQNEVEKTVKLDRNRLFALLGALEEDLRFIIEVHLLTTHHEEQILGQAYERAARRLASDEHRDITQTSIVDYLDLGDEIGILQQWRRDLPAQTRDSIEEQSARLHQLVPIRNRVAHRRPLLVDDCETAEQILVQLDRDGFEGPN